MASMGSMVPASPAAMTAFIMLCAIQGSLLLMPSTMKKLSWGRRPLVAWVQPELPGYFYDARTQIQQVLKIPAVQRQIVDHLVAERSAERRSWWCRASKARSDFDLLADVTSLEYEVLSQILSYLQGDAGLLCDFEAFSSARTRLFPGTRLGALYSPASSVVAVRSTPRSTSMIVTVTPGTGAPLWSLTVPRMRPKFACENSRADARSINRPAPRMERVLFAPVPFTTTRNCLLNMEAP